MTAHPSMYKVVHHSKLPSTAAAFRHPLNPCLSMHIHGNTITNVGRNVGSDAT